MAYKLYFHGEPYSNKKYESLEEAKRDAKMFNDQFGVHNCRLYGLVYVAYDWGGYVKNQ